MSNSIKVKVLNRNTLELSEDVKAGDFIELDKIESLYTGFITDLISKERDAYIKNKIEEELKKQAHPFELEKQKLFPSLLDAATASFKRPLSYESYRPK